MHGFIQHEGPMAYMISIRMKLIRFGVMDSKIRPHSGNKFLAAFASTDDVNNDFIISPELNFNKDLYSSSLQKAIVKTTDKKKSA